MTENDLIEIDMYSVINQKYIERDVLDEIRAEIEQYESDCLFADDSKECKECDKIVFGSIYRIIDKYKAESEDKERWGDNE